MGEVYFYMRTKGYEGNFSSLVLTDLKKKPRETPDFGRDSTDFFNRLMHT